MKKDKKNNKEHKKEKKEEHVRSSVSDIAKGIRYTGTRINGNIYTDVNGSYTGLDYDGERPVQDADDL